MVLWVFGCGSVMWTREFRYVERLNGFVKDYRRVLAGGGDGNGSPGSANLGLALESQEGAMTTGVAYRVTADVEEEILHSFSTNKSSSGNLCQTLMLDFFIPSSSDVPIIPEVMTFIGPRIMSSRFWYSVLQDLPQRRTSDTTSGISPLQMFKSSPTSQKGEDVPQPRTSNISSDIDVFHLQKFRGSLTRGRQSVKIRYQKPIAGGFDTQCWSTENTSWHAQSVLYT